LNRIVIGTRASQLALWQTEWVAARLRSLQPDLEIVIRRITTQGDTASNVPLPQIGGTGVFTREIEAALRADEIQLAVHSLKDLPTDEPPGLTLAAITERQDARDVVVSRLGLGWRDLPAGGRIGTSSTRRAAQLAALRPDVQVVSLRGNVDTRVRKARTEDYAAIVLAAAGVLRLGLEEHITEYLPPEVMLPAVGQGALAVQAREDDADTLKVLAQLDHAPTRAAATAERAFLRALGGGCHVPIAAYGEPAGPDLRLGGWIAAPDGSRSGRGELAGKSNEAGAIGQGRARQMLAAGGQEILRT